MKKLVREIKRGLRVSFLAVFLAVLVGASLWASEGFPLSEKSGMSDSESEAEEQGELSVEVPSVYVVQPSEQGSQTAEAGEAENTENREEAEPIETETSETSEEETDSGEQKEDVTLLFAGDLYLTEQLQEKYGKSGISAAATSGLLSVTKDADIFMLNEEFPFGTTGEAADKQYTFRVNPKYVSLLPELGVDIVTLANNHMLDFGREPLTETLQTLDEAGILHVGAGENLKEASALKTMEAGGRIIGFLGATRVIPENSWTATSGNSGLFTTYDATKLLAEIREAKQSCDYVVVFVHWGIERNTTPEDYQKSLARQYIDAGADAVIGAHPHVLQGIEYYNGKPIFYSLGNFIFANRSYETMMAELTLTGDSVDVRVIPCVSTSNQMDLMKESQRAGFYSSLQELCFEGVTVGEDGSVSKLSEKYKKNMQYKEIKNFEK